MMYTATVTRQGQITIPSKVRHKLGIDRRRVIISEENGKILIEPVKDLLELRGSLKTNKKPLSNRQLHELFADYTAKEYAGKR